MAKRLTKTEKKRNAKRLAEKRISYPRLVNSIFKQELGERLAKTKQLLPLNALVGDLHIHTTFSDGVGTVEEMKDVADHCGLDFIFITDHNSLGQKRQCRRFERVWFGQEPGGASHHIGLLAPRRLFKPKRQTIADDIAAAQALAPFVWIPHPVGWWPSTWYDDEKIDTLWTLGDEFAIEVMNAANKLVRAYDPIDAKAVATWDTLLAAGKKVTAVGASDAHLPAGIGTVWTGVFAEECEMDSVIAALRAGHCFASEAPLLKFACGRKKMGDTVKVKPGKQTKLRAEAADSAGLHSIRLVCNGEIVDEQRLHDAPLAKLAHTVSPSTLRCAYRVECTASDQRRAFSSPIYVEPVT